jgi:hypothetical protein
VCIGHSVRFYSTPFVFLTNAFTSVYERLKADELADEEDPEEDLAERTFWVPKDARWSREISSVGVSGDCLGGPEILSYAITLTCSIDADIKQCVSRWLKGALPNL